MHLIHPMQYFVVSYSIRRCVS